MGSDIIKNYDKLANTKQREDVLKIAEAGLESIQPENVVSKKFFIRGGYLNVSGTKVDLSKYQGKFVIGYGKGCSYVVGEVEDVLRSHFTEGYVIDNVSNKIKSKLVAGSHPVPSEKNYRFAQSLVDRFDGKLREDDLVFVVTCGGGSSMLAYPNRIGLERKIEANRELLSSGMDIKKMNAVRKHLSGIKGGQLAKMLYPARVFGLIFSDVPGNDMTSIASGPTVYDPTTADDAMKILREYGMDKRLGISGSDLNETPKSRKIFRNVCNKLLLKPEDLTRAMLREARALGYDSMVVPNPVEGEAKDVGPKLLSLNKGGILISSGETTVTLPEDKSSIGVGGRNQELVLSSVIGIDESTTIISMSTDGVDFQHFAGAIGDVRTLDKASFYGADPKKHLKRHDSTGFFKKVEDGVLTGKLKMNLSDFQITLRV